MGMRAVNAGVGNITDAKARALAKAAQLSAALRKPVKPSKKEKS